MLRFDDWLKLSNEEKKEKYKELSKQDKFKVRMGEYYNANKKVNTSTEFMKEIDKLYKEYEKNKKNL